MYVQITNEYIPIAIANYYIRKSNPRSDYSVDILKLLKLIYIMYGYVAAYFDK